MSAVRLGLACGLCMAVVAVGCGGDEDATGASAPTTEPSAAEETSLPEPVSAQGAERVKLSDRLEDEVQIPEGPDWMVVAFGSLWVKQDSGGVFRIDPETGKTLAEIAPSTSGGHPCQGIGASEDAIWSCPQDGVIDRIDPATDEVAASVRIDKLLDQGRLVVAADLLWVLTDSGEKLTGIDARTNKPETTVDLGVRGVDLAADGTTVWVMCPTDGRVLRVDAEAREVTGELELAGAANGAAGDDLWVSFEGGVAQIDRETLEILATYEVASRYGGSILATTDAVWVRQDGGPFLTRIDPASHEIVEAIDAPELPSGGNVVEIDGSLWATAFDDETLVKLRADRP